MGLGKTFVGSEKMMSFNNDTNILICQKSKIEDWKNHFETHYNDIKVFDIRKNKKTLGEFQNYNSKKLAIINYELAFRKNSLLEFSDFTLMLDESSMIQNETAKRTKFILKMKPKNVILLSGTPTSGKYEKLYSQLKLLGWNISKTLYWKQYINFVINKIGNVKFQQVIGYKNVDRLKWKLREHGAIFMKSDEVFDLPEMMENFISIEKTKAYSKFMKNLIVTIDNDGDIFVDDSDFYGKDVTSRQTLVGDTSLTKLLYARQLCGQFSKDKLETLKELLESTEDRLIIFYNFTEELERIKKLTDRPISVVNGKNRDLEAYENCENSITLIQYQAGAMGLNLQKSNKIIYFTLPLSSELFEQSKKRIHRIGQNKICFYYYLICKGTVEETIMETLKMRKDYTDELFKEEKL